jgi:hypothetical protein
MDFTDVLIPDSVPELADVEYPCNGCGKEAGPYGGRGPKPKWCGDCRPKKGKGSSGVRVTGAPANLAAQAAGVLEQLNGMLAIGLTAVGFFDTAGALAQANGTFKEQAYQALLTDPELCKLILKGGVKSAKISLGLAYCGLSVAVAPTAVNEFREKKAERDAKREADENETRTEYP